MRKVNGEFDVASEAASSSSNSNGEPSPPATAMALGSAATAVKEEPSSTGGMEGSLASSPSSAVVTSSVAGGREKTLCLVCSVVSDNHHIHYGALACFSCRAFFRRAHNKSGGSSDPPNYICKHDGKCDITSKNRKKCQKCRYDKCIEIGMNPNLVLTDDQKKVRFRKMFEKKGSGAIEVNHGGNNGSKPVPVMSSATTSRDSVMSCISRQIDMLLTSMLK